MLYKLTQQSPKSQLIEPSFNKCAQNDLQKLNNQTKLLNKADWLLKVNCYFVTCNL